MEVDRRVFLATLGVGALELMSPEDKAEALEHYMMEELDKEGPLVGPDGQPVASPESTHAAADGEAGALEEKQDSEGPRTPRGTGRLFMPNERELEAMSSKPTLFEFFEKRFAPANHVLQSATHALKTDQPERTILACLLHDVVLNLIKVDHGWWGAQLIEPYVDERVSWGIRYHAALRFYPDESVGYEYPEMYNRIFGGDYVPEPYIEEAYKYARKAQVVHGRPDDHGERYVRIRAGCQGIDRAVHRHHRSSLQTAEGRAGLRQQRLGPHVAYDRLPESAAVGDSPREPHLPLGTAADRNPLAFRFRL